MCRPLQPIGFHSLLAPTAKLRRRSATRALADTQRRKASQSGYACKQRQGAPVRIRHKFDRYRQNERCGKACEHLRSLAAPVVRGQTVLRYKVNGSAEMTEKALVRALQR